MKNLFLFLFVFQIAACTSAVKNNREISSTEEEKESEVTKKSRPQLGPYTRALHEGFR